MDLISADRLRDIIIAVGKAFNETAGEIDKSVFVECGSYPGTVAAGATVSIACRCTVRGTFVAVWMARASTGKTALTLCEVEVYASESLFPYN